MLKTAIAPLIAAATVSPAFATSGPGCLIVVNALNVRAAPSASARIADVLPLSADLGAVRL